MSKQLTQEQANAVLAESKRVTKCVQCGAKHHGEITTIGDTEWTYVCVHCVELKAIGAGQIREVE